MNNHCFWGNNIYFKDNDRITGNIYPIPKKGDRFLADMDSGRRAYFQATKIKTEKTKNDIFWATVKFIKYED